MTKREKNEILHATLMAGGYFEKKLERGYNGREQFETRLYTADHEVVRGFGASTFYDHQSSLQKDYDVMPGSTWREVWRNRTT